MLCENLCNLHKNPINCFLHLVAGILLIYALWNHNLKLILISILIALVGHIIQGFSERKPKRKR